MSYWIGAAASSSNPFDSVTSFFKSSTWRFVEYMFVFVLVLDFMFVFMLMHFFGLMFVVVLFFHLQTPTLRIKLFDS